MCVRRYFPAHIELVLDRKSLEALSLWMTLGPFRVVVSEVNNLLTFFDMTLEALNCLMESFG